MNDIFIREIIVNKVRHLQDINIPISVDERKHLILTGKNGSGKTSLLEAIRRYLLAIQSNELFKFPAYKHYIEGYKHSIIEIEAELSNSIDEKQRFGYRTEIANLNNLINSYEQRIAQVSNVDLELNNLELLQTEYDKGICIISFFDAKRSAQLIIPNGIQKLEIKDVYPIEEKANQIFIQYLVNLKAQRSFARDANNMKLVEDIDNWFVTFEKYLREIFEDDSLRLDFDSNNFNFNILQKHKEIFDLNTLSDGYSAILNIITELIIRMEKKSSRIFKTQGIVLIDEIETHLHIELQKLILPFLIKVFPKIQFIVTTHSPFVITSISNAVIYDLENRIIVSDLSGFSVEGIIEGYFNSDKYSNILKNMVAEYENLAQEKQLDVIEKERYIELKKYFKDISKFMSPELELKIQQIELLKIK